MDREYFESNDIASMQPSDRIERPISVAEVGQSVIAGRGKGDFIQTVTSAIRAGAGVIELQPGPGEGEPGAAIEDYGTEKRQELREIAKASGVELSSVHVSPQVIGNVSGINYQQRRFSEEERFREVSEVKKAIDMAADVGAEAVVVHTGEFPRTIYDKYRDFKQYTGEEEDAIYHLVDPTTGRIIESVADKQEVWMPIPKKDKYGNEMFLLGEDGKPVIDEFTEEKIPIFEYDEKGNVKTQKLKFRDFKEEKLKQGWKMNDIVKDFFKMQQQAEVSHALGSAREYEKHYFKGLEERDRILKALEFFKKIKEHVPKEKWVAEYRKKVPGGLFLPDEVVDPVDYFRDLLNENERNIAYGRELAISGRKQARMYMDAVKKAVPIEEFGKDKSMQSLAELGIMAMNKTHERGLKKDIFVAPENIFPEMGYGSHPDELIELVHGARKKMVEELRKKYPGMSEARARKEAEEHIKATFDTQHMGMWRKHFIPKPGETEEQTDKRFNKWYMDQVKKLQKAGVLGHIHLVDGFGYGHTHLPVGSGVHPIPEAVDYLKKKGFKGKMISEGYAEGDRRMLTKMWEALGSPITRERQIMTGGLAPSPPGMTTAWTNIQEGYFGRTQTPYYHFGEHSPDPNEWTLWSGVRLE